MSAEAWSAIAAGISAIGGLAAVVVAVFSWRAGQRAADAGTSMTEIERRRLHNDMTPTFEVSVSAAAVGDHATLAVRFVGPPALHTLQVGVSIRNDRPRKPVGAAATQEELDAQIWGPYRFTIGDSIREVAPMTIQPGDRAWFDLSKTLPPPWTTGEWWRSTYEGQPVRIGLQCFHSGFEPWTLHMDVDVDVPAG